MCQTEVPDAVAASLRKSCFAETVDKNLMRLPFDRYGPSIQKFENWAQAQAAGPPSP